MTRFAIGLGNTVYTFGWKPLVKRIRTQEFVVVFGPDTEGQWQ